MASFDFSCDLLRSFAAISSSGTHWRNVANRTSANLLMYGNPGHFCLATHFVSPLHPVPPNDTPKMAIFIQGMRNMLRSLQKMLSFKCLIINTVSLVTVSQRGSHFPARNGRRWSPQGAFEGQTLTFAVGILVIDSQLTLSRGGEW